MENQEEAGAGSTDTGPPPVRFSFRRATVSSPSARRTTVPGSKPRSTIPAGRNGVAKASPTSSPPGAPDRYSQKPTPASASCSGLIGLSTRTCRREASLPPNTRSTSSTGLLRAPHPPPPPPQPAPALIGAGQPPRRVVQGLGCYQALGQAPALDDA